MSHHSGSACSDSPRAGCSPSAPQHNTTPRAAPTSPHPSTRPPGTTTWHDYQVPSDAPPLFLCFAADDPGEGVIEGNLALHRNWLSAGHSVEMHVYAAGGHGFAEGSQDLPCDTWLDRYLDWLRWQGLLR